MKKNKKSMEIQSENKSLVSSVVIVITALFLVIAPFKQGLFNGVSYNFENAIYSSVIVAMVVLIVISLKLFNSWRLQSHRDILSLFVLFIPLSYFISTFGAASTHRAINDVYIHLLWIAFFLIGAYFANSKSRRSILQLSLIGSGYILVVYGLLNWFGNAKYSEAVLEGHRLSNTFQYPNSYAAYLLALLVSTLILINALKNWKWAIVPSMMLTPIMVSLLLTLSRGAFLVLPVILIVYYCFIPWIRQALTSVYLAVSGIAALLLFNKMISIREKVEIHHTNSLSVQGWLLLIGVSSAVSMVVIVARKYMDQWITEKNSQDTMFKWGNFAIPLVGILIAGIAFGLIKSVPGIIEPLPKEIQTRIEGISSHTTNIFSRNTFYSDALKIAGDYPIFGAGGGAWSVLYDSYKSYPYSSTQAHNFYVQYLVETGIFGVMILLIFLVYVLFMFIRYAIRTRNKSDWDESNLIFLVIGLSILVHSVIDFDMSFVYLAAVVFLSLGALTNLGNKPVALLENPRKKVRDSAPTWSRGYSIVLLIVSIVVLIMSIQDLKAANNFQKAVDITMTTRNYNEIQKPLDTALKINSTHPDYAMFKINLLGQLYQQTKEEIFKQEAWKLIESTKKKEPHNQLLIDREYTLYKLMNDYKSAIELYVAETNHYPWNIKFYNEAITLGYNQGSLAKESGNKEERDFYWNKSIQAFNKLEDQLVAFDQYRSGAAKSEKKDFTISPQIALLAGKIYYEMGDYAKAEKTIGIGRVSSDFTIDLNKEIARWYTASQEMQNKHDPKFIALLLAADPTEKEKIEQIINRPLEVSN